MRELRVSKDYVGCCRRIPKGEIFELREGTGEMKMMPKAFYALAALEAADVGRLNVPALKTSFSMFPL